MKRIFIVFLLIIFSSSFSFVQSNEKITVKEIEDLRIIELKNALYNYENSTSNPNKKWLYDYEEQKKRVAEPSYKKRIQARNAARCLYPYYYMSPPDKNSSCKAQVIRAVLSYSEKSKERRPGDIFYVMDIVTHTLKNPMHQFFLKGKYHYSKARIYDGSESYPGMLCHNEKMINFYKFDKKNYGKTSIQCVAFNKSFYKQFEKFKKDPSNEKILGKKFIKQLKKLRSLQNIEEKIGKRDFENYALLGDFLNATVADVKKNNVLPELKQRRVFLKKYSLILSNIKKKLDEEKYKSINKDVLKLSKTYKTLKTLKTNSNETVITIDKAVNIIFDINKLVQTSALNAKDSEEEKLLSLASINFIESLIDSILDIIPKKYYVISQQLPQGLFSESDLEQLELVVNFITKQNNKIKSTEFTKNMDVINKSINPYDVVKKLENLKIYSIKNKPLSSDAAANLATQQIRNNLDPDIFRSAKKIFDNMDKNELSELTKEASSIASEVASSSSVKDTVSVSAVDREYGGQNLKKLIGAARR